MAHFVLQSIIDNQIVHVNTRHINIIYEIIFLKEAKQKALKSIYTKEKKLGTFGIAGDNSHVSFI